jgi:hypothetical protein
MGKKHMNKNEDEMFFEQFHEAPPADVVAGVYKRIDQPMNAQGNLRSVRKIVLTSTIALLLMIASLLTYQPIQAQALNFLRQIGVFTVTTENESDTPLPTALPPDPDQKPITSASAVEASKLAGFQVFAPAWLPDGYLAEGGISILPNGNGKVVVTGFADSETGSFILINQYRAGLGDSFTNYVSGNETVQDIQLRGHDGVWITGRLMTNPMIAEQQDKEALRESSWLIWEEKGIAYTIISNRLSQEEMLKVAESMK